MVNAGRYRRVTVPQRAVEIEENGTDRFLYSARWFIHGSSLSLSRSWFVLVECRDSAIREPLMSNSNVPNLPPVTAEQRRVAVGKFERANQVIATWNFDYGIHLLMDCCKIDPANLVYRQKLRATEKVKYRNNLRGSLFAKLTSWPIRARMKTALRSRDYLKVLEHGERIMMRNPWDVGAQMDMAEAADMLGLLDLAVWILEQARQKQPLDAHVNRALARQYEKRGNFTQAIALWEIIRKVKPSDPEAQHKVKDLAADDTIARGQYQAVIRSNEGSGEKPA